MTQVPDLEAAQESPLSADMRRDSARTWRDLGVGSATAVPPLLTDAAPRAWRGRQTALWARHRLRRERAQEHVAQAQDPERGLPVASGAAVVAYLRGLLVQRRGLVTAVVLANALAAAAGLAVPMLLGRLVDQTVAAGGAVGTGTITRFAVLLGLVLVLQAGMAFLAKWTAAVLGHGVLEQAREHVVRSVLRLPLGRVESTSTGDLVTRVSRDVGAMSDSVRWALPEFIIGVVTVLLTIVAMLLNSWQLALPTLLLVALSGFQIRAYLREAPSAYLFEGATYSRINSSLTETVEGARTLEALRMAPVRRRVAADDITVSAQAERYGLVLAQPAVGVMDVAFSLPRVLTLGLGAVGYAQGWVGLGQLTAAMLYVETLYEPFDRLVGTVDRLQVGVASTTRLLGIAAVPPVRSTGDVLPQRRDLLGHDLRFAYREGHDVLHGIDLELSTGERLAIVGPSGSGKSTLGRLLAGIHAPRTGSVTVGDVELTVLPLDVLRREVTQEHHVFRGSVRDNVLLAREDASEEAVQQALRTVDAWPWVAALPDGLDTVLGSGNQPLTPPQAQQVALARLILADPHTLVLDEATSLIDPRTARHLEGSMSALLTGRTVVAIAHRLHTAHDADRIAVVIDGRVAELGSHGELLEMDGEYAALWRAWTS